MVSDTKLQCLGRVDERWNAGVTTMADAVLFLAAILAVASVLAGRDAVRAWVYTRREHRAFRRDVAGIVHARRLHRGW